MKKIDKDNLIDRLEFYELGCDTEHEIWIDYKIMTKYKIEVETIRNWDNIEKI